LAHRLALMRNYEALLLIALIAVAITSGLAMQGMGGHLKQIAEVNNHKTKLANDLMNNISDMAILARNITLFTDVGKIDGEAKLFANTKKAYLDAEAALASTMETTGANDEEKALFAEIQASSKKTVPLVTSAAQQGSDGDNVSAVLTLTNKVQPEEFIWRKKVAELIALQDKLSADATASASSSQRQALMAALALVVASVAIGTLIALWITRSVTRPIAQMQTMMSEIASSQDFSRRVPVERMDEIGMSIVAFNAMIGKIQESSQQLKQKTADIQAMMHYIPQGILTVMDGKKVHPEFSAYLLSFP
jgi:nitrogen fixation/metabolism regulation signal transduction histidine kinase